MKLIIGLLQFEDEGSFITKKKNSEEEKLEYSWYRLRFS